MKRWIALLLAAACLFALCACGEDTAQEPTPANDNPTPASQTGVDAPETTDSGTSTGDAETDLAWAVGSALCPGFDSLMDRGKYTVDGKECRLYYYVTDGRFAGEVCIAPDGSVYLDREGTLNWQIVTPDGNGNYLTQPLNPNTPQITQSPSGGDDDEAQATPREEQQPGQAGQGHCGAESIRQPAHEGGYPCHGIHGIRPGAEPRGSCGR